MHSVVLGRGPVNSRKMIVGEAPGETEAHKGEPFVGRAGKELQKYLEQGGDALYRWYRTNVVKEYLIGNPEPTPALIAKWTPALLNEIALVKPQFIIAAGVHAIRWFLGPDADLGTVHGLPWRSDRAPGAVVIPCYHPAAGFYNDESRTFCAVDYRNAVLITQGKLPSTPVEDEYPNAAYLDVTGEELAGYLDEQRKVDPHAPISIDTEGSLDGSWNWSIQITTVEGTGLVLQYGHTYFDTGIRAILRYCLTDPKPITVFHNAMHDLYPCREMGADLFDCRLFDTRYAAYIMRTEPQGLKALARRWCGMKMRDYAEVVGDVGVEKQLDYLVKVMELTADWPKPEPRLIMENDGTASMYKPQPIARRAEAIILDRASGKTDKDGELTDIMGRWRKCDRELRKEVEQILGPMPIGTLADIPLADAVHYAGRDPDATLRLYHRLLPVVRARKQIPLADQGNGVLPVFEEMQANGMPFSRAYCQSKYDEMTEYMQKLQSKISNRYYGGEPFNPGSPDKVAALMRRRGLVGEKTSRKTGKVSTGKKSIEHLRYTDAAMADIIDWREHQKMRDAFYGPIIERLGDREWGWVRTHINPYKVVSRRIAASDPNLTAIPVRNDLGVAVRDGAQAEPGYCFGSWDLSQIEMRVMADLSRDPLLCKFLREDKDVHRETAARIFRIPIDKVEERAHRYPAKRAGFGIITNIAGQGLYDQLRMFGCTGWSVEKCDALIEDWLGVYTGVRDYIAAAADEAVRTGEVVDMWGMPRPLPGVWSDDFKVRAEAQRAASSMKIQGGAQGMLQSAIHWLKPRIRYMREDGIDVRWLLQIHDEVILYFPEAHWDEINALVLEGLTQHHGVAMSVPVKASGSHATTWGKLK